MAKASPIEHTTPEALHTIHSLRFTQQAEPRHPKYNFGHRGIPKCNLGTRRREAWNRLVHAGGMPASSRAVERGTSDTPGARQMSKRILKGCQRRGFKMHSSERREKAPSGLLDRQQPTVFHPARPSPAVTYIFGTDETPPRFGKSKPPVTIDEIQTPISAPTVTVLLQFHSICNLPSSRFPLPRIPAATASKSSDIPGTLAPQPRIRVTLKVPKLPDAHLTANRPRSHLVRFDPP
jgi:hypothetical protein